MDDLILIEQRVSVAVVFSGGHDGRVTCYPVKMRWQGKEVRFTELALRHPTSKGQRMIHVFDMSDGAADYRLEFDAEGLTWTLMAVLEGSHAA